MIMMKFFRKYMKPILMVTAGALILGTFAMYGSNFLFGNKNVVASVNGTEISAERYFRTLSQALQNYREKQSAEPDEATLKRMKEDIVRDFVQEELFYQEAKKMGIDISKQALISTIQSYSVFHHQGQFNPSKYFMVLKEAFRSTPAQFEEETRIRIINSRLRNLIVSSIKLSDREIRDEYARLNKNDMKNFEKDKAKFSEQVLNEKRYHVLNTWFQQIAEKAKIKITLDKVEAKA